MYYGKTKKNNLINKKNIKNAVKVYKPPHPLKTDKETKFSGNALIKNAYSKDLKNLNDEELNTLEYEIALKYDKRSYFKYYWSLLKKKQLVLFTFLPANDYNVFSIKLSLFLIAFSLYFSINGFFL